MHWPEANQQQALDVYSREHPELKLGTFHMPVTASVSLDRTLELSLRLTQLPIANLGVYIDCYGGEGEV